MPKAKANGHRVRDSFIKAKRVLRGEYIKLTRRDHVRIGLVLRKADLETN